MEDLTVNYKTKSKYIKFCNVNMDRANKDGKQKGKTEGMQSWQLHHTVGSLEIHYN